MINLTSGEAKELVKPFRPEYGFANAMRLLEKQYGNPHKLLACYRKEIKQMTKIKPGDAAAYRRLFNFLIKCQSLEYGSQNPLDTPDVICMILAKIPEYLQDRWNRSVQKIRKVQMREPGLIDLTNVIEDEMVLVNDPLLSREAVGQYEEKSLKQQSRSTKHKFQAHVIKEIGDSAKRDKAKCPVCDDHHDIEEYQVFLIQTTEDRTRTPYKKKLCYGCLGNISKEHNGKCCANRRMCKVCCGRHPTVLHGLKTQKYKKKGNNKDIETKEDKPEEVKYASANTRSDVISMCIVPVQIKSKDTIKTFHTYALLDSCSQGTFILDQLASDLAISGRKTSLTIKTLNGEFINNSTALEGLKVVSISEGNKEWLPLPRTFTRADLPVDNDDITKPSQLRKWKYLKNVINQLIFSEDIYVGYSLEPTAQRHWNQLKYSKVKMVDPMHLKLDSAGVWLV